MLSRHTIGATVREDTEIKPAQSDLTLVPHARATTVAATLDTIRALCIRLSTVMSGDGVLVGNVRDRRGW